MNRITTWFHTHTFLSDMLVRYSAHNRILEDENAKLRKKLGAKDKLLERAQADHRQSNSFHQTVISNLQTQINTFKAVRRTELEQAEPAEISFTLPNGVVIYAKHDEDESWESIDIMASAPNGRSERVCCADFDRDESKLRVFAFDGTEDEYVQEIADFNMDYLLGQDDISPETEAEYIDQVIQDQVDQHDATADFSAFDVVRGATTASVHDFL